MEESQMEFKILYFSMYNVLCYNQIALGIDEEEAAGLNNIERFNV